MIEPVHPFQSGVFHGLNMAPGPTVPDDPGFVQVNDRLAKALSKEFPDYVTERWVSAIFLDLCFTRKPFCDLMGLFTLAFKSKPRLE